MENLFPYLYREGQEELVRTIRDEIWDSNVCLHAPTGYGKTPVILAALLAHRDYNIIWAVRTGNETDRPIEELKVINRCTDNRFFGFSYRGKRDMCLLAKETDMEGRITYGDVAFLCQERREDCPYRQNLEEVNPAEFVETPLLYSELFELSRNNEVCPYYAQQRLLPFASVVSLSYNYIVNEPLSWAIRRFVPFQRSFLVVDEAHNLQKACSSLNSGQITLRTLNRSLNELDKIEAQGAEEMENLVLTLLQELQEVKLTTEKESVFDVEDFLQGIIEDLGQNLVEFGSILNQAIALGTQIRRKQMNEGKRPRSSLHRLGQFSTRALDNLEIEGVTFLAKPERDTLILEMWDMRSAEILKDRWKDFKGCVFCSGTLRPFGAFTSTAGIVRSKNLNVGSFYDSRKIMSLIPAGLSTKGRELSVSMARRYVRSIVGFARGMQSNVAAFSASYRIQRALLESGLREKIEDEGMAFYQEKRGMDGTLARRILDDFKQKRHFNEHGFLCAPATGRFAEGTDFPGEELEGIFLVGIPFDRMSVRTELYLKYYRKLYGRRKGRYYGYIVPALRKASQALGRLLRSKEDKGLFVCGDQRYGDRRFFRLLPDYVRNNIRRTRCDLLEADVRAWVQNYALASKESN